MASKGKGYAAVAAGAVRRNFGVLFVAAAATFVATGIAVLILCGVDGVILGLLDLQPGPGIAGMMLSMALVLVAALAFVAGWCLVSLCGWAILAAAFVSHTKLSPQV